MLKSCSVFFYCCPLKITYFGWKFENLFVNFVFGEIIVLGCVDYDWNQQLPPVLPWGLSDCIFCVFLYFPILYFLLYKLGLSTVCLETTWRASVTCPYFWVWFCICLCVFHRACILNFYTSYFTFLTKQAEYGKIGSSRPTARHLPSLWRSLFVLVLFVFVLFVFLYFCVFLFHISYWVRCDWKQQAQRPPPARPLRLWGLDSWSRSSKQGKCPQLPSWVLVHFRLLACHHQFNLIRTILCYVCPQAT